MSIEISNISKTYGTQQVLKNISFKIGSGEIVGFLGPNGAGKTTTMRILAGSLNYDGGSAKICETDVKENPLETKKNVGYLPEQNPLYTDMYVREYLLFVAETYKLGKEKRKRVEELIDLVGLRNECKKKIGQLSKGYRQRVGLAQALIHNPEVLILDEPTTGLDPNQLVEIRNLIKEIGKNRTVLFSTHIMQEIEAVCNRVIIISKGEIVADYPDVKEISTFGKNEFHLEVEFSDKLEKDALKSIKSIKNIQTKDEKTFTLTSEKDIRSNIFDFAVKTNNKILTLKPLGKKMEEVFRELTK
ncbi:Protein involved in gliding motility GldA [uncultured Paludibacter sp.]|uniref:Protein involved in gliding motility GldA n=1 Tax=uncultured Paludibacter sp. TaxID=497635 RepID=A0A653AGR8_9BACT|nr:Protein involved in gliding motility GldA [uncultured Paludibacter sp.]